MSLVSYPGPTETLYSTWMRPLPPAILLSSWALRISAVQSDKVEKYMTKFKRTGTPYTVIAPSTPLAELEAFLAHNIFAIVTDWDRKFVLGVVTSQDLEVRLSALSPSSTFLFPTHTCFSSLVSSDPYARPLMFESPKTLYLRSWASAPASSTNALSLIMTPSAELRLSPGVLSRVQFPSLVCISVTFVFLEPLRHRDFVLARSCLHRALPHCIHVVPHASPSMASTRRFHSSFSTGA